MRRPEVRLALCLLGAGVYWPWSASAAIDCLDTETALEYWRPIRELVSQDGMPADELAPELVSCLGSMDPELRDRIGYELFAYWLRQEQLDDQTRRGLLDSLSGRLQDSNTLSRSFSALILAEIMRSDAAKPFMTAAERQTLLDRAATALSGESDFRGLDPEIGWVHPVAHMADLLWRFALHPATTAEQVATILAAVRTKVAPDGATYAFNEGDRLARVVATIIRDERLDAGRLGEWIVGFQSPRSMQKWSDAFASPSGMAELHNTKQFLRALSDQLADVEVDPAISEPLAALVKGFTGLI